MRVLIVKLSSLGDVVHAMPVVHDILAAHPGALIDWVAEPAFAPLVRRVAGVHEVMPFALRRWRRAWWTADVRSEWGAFRKGLKRERYDAVIDLQGLTKSALVARMANGPSYGIGNRTEGSGWEWPARWLVERPIMIALRTHAVDRARFVAAQALGYVVAGRPIYGLQHSSQTGSSTVAFVHGTSREDKLWPESYWIDLGRRLIDSGLRIALPRAGEVERERAERLAAALGEAVDIWPEMDLGRVCDALGATRGVIGVDSGLSHIAVALALPHVQIYNHPSAWRTGPIAAHGHDHQVSVVAKPTPSVDEVFAAWRAVARP